MRQPDLGRLFDILDAAEAVREFIAGMDEEAFRNDRKTQSAVIREMLVMGEAANTFRTICGSPIPRFPGAG